MDDHFFRSFFELLIGTDYVRKMIKEGKSAEEIKARWKDDVEKFKVQRKDVYKRQGKTYGDIFGFETDRYFEEKDFTSQTADGSWNYANGIASQAGLESGNFFQRPRLQPCRCSSLHHIDRLWHRQV